MISFKLISFFFLILCIEKTFAHEIEADSFNIKGKWKVVDYYVLINEGREISQKDTQSRKENILFKCLDARITFDEARMFIEPPNVCNFLPCDNFRLSEIKIMEKLPDTLEYHKYPGDEIRDYNKVSKHFLKMINYDKDTVFYYDTPCLIDWGSATLKIFLVDTNHIVLFGDIDITFLERIPF